MSQGFQQTEGRGIYAQHIVTNKILILEADVREDYI